MTRPNGTPETTRPLRLSALPPLSRRAFLGGLGVAALGAATLGGAPAFATSDGTVLPLVAALPPGAPDRALFAPNEQIYASYLLVLAPIANSVVDDDPARYGWLEDGWQRMPNEPFNARIMEHVATLSWFATHERPWNPYYLDANLLGRLDAALGYYLALQHDDGSYPEYSPTEHHLSPTGFGTVAQSATLRDLRSVGALPHRHAEIEAAIRASSAWLTNLSNPHWNVPVQYANQVTAGLAGVAQTAEVLGDPAIAAELADRTAFLLENGMAPAGFFHEPMGADAGYNFEVMTSDLGHIHEQTGDQTVLEMARRWADWTQYVQVLEPNAGPVGFHFAGVSTRTLAITFAPTAEDRLDRSAMVRALVEEVPELAPYLPTAEEKAAARATWAADPTPVPPRVKQDTSPRLYMHVSEAPDGTTPAERDAQLAQLRPSSEKRFTELRRGTLDQQYLFVRRPDYYLGAMYGIRASDRNRMGPGLLWHPKAGMVVLSLNNDPHDSWTTITASGVEASRSHNTVTHHRGDSARGPAINPDELTGRTSTFTSRFVTSDGAITTDVTVKPNEIVKKVAVAGAATEEIPLVVGPDDVIEFSDGTKVRSGGAATVTARWFALTRGKVRFRFEWKSNRSVTFASTSRVFFADQRRRHHLVTVGHDGGLTMTISVEKAKH